jgi:hypothetical protein
MYRRGDYLESACYYIERITGIKARRFNSGGQLERDKDYVTLLFIRMAKLLKK